MASINATTSSGIVATADNTGQLALQAAGTTIATISSTGLTMNSGNIIQASGAAPAFSAYPSTTQSISGGTWAKMQINTEDWDTANCYDSTTNYRFTPNVAGYYQVNASVESNAVAQAYFLCAVYKNGSVIKYGSNIATSAAAGPNAILSVVVYLNGTTDYIELYAIGTSSWTRQGSSLGSYFQASMIRSA